MPEYEAELMAKAEKKNAEAENVIPSLR